MSWYRPDAICLQCGADSLVGDRLGSFNLTTKGTARSTGILGPASHSSSSSTGHAKAVEFVKSFGKPMLVVGGGGYTIRNVARCWANETGVLLGEQLDDKLPANEFIDYYGPDYRLHIEPSNAINHNTPEYLQSTLYGLFVLLSQFSPL